MALVPLGALREGGGPGGSPPLDPLLAPLSTPPLLPLGVGPQGAAGGLGAHWPGRAGTWWGHRTSFGPAEGHDNDVHYKNLHNQNRCHH